MGKTHSVVREPTGVEMRCWGLMSRHEALTPSDTFAKIPAASRGTIVIKVAAAGVHPHDITRPVHTHGTRYPAICGTDGVGVVHEVGEGVSGWSPGMWAMFRTPARSQSGSWAQYVVVEAPFVAPYPAQVGVQYAAALPTPWWSAQLIYDYLIPRSSGTEAGSCLIVGADCENGLEMYLCDLLKASGTPWEVNVVCDDRKEAIFREHGFDAVIPARAVPRHQNGALNLPGALRAAKGVCSVENLPGVAIGGASPNGSPVESRPHAAAAGAVVSEAAAAAAARTDGAAVEASSAPAAAAAQPAGAAGSGANGNVRCKTHSSTPVNVYHDVVVVLRPDLAGLHSGRELAAVAKFGATIILVDSSATGSGLQPADVSQSLTRSVAGFDVVTADLMMVHANIRLFNLDAWILAMPGVIAEVARRGPPTRLIHADSVPRERALEAVAALAAHRVRTKVAIIIKHEEGEVTGGSGGTAAQLAVLKDQPPLVEDGTIEPSDSTAGAMAAAGGMGMSVVPPAMVTPGGPRASEGGEEVANVNE